MPQDGLMRAKTNNTKTNRVLASDDQEERMKKFLSYILGCGLFVIALNASAASLTGILTIDAGTRGPVEVDPVNDPGVFANLYIGGSYFAMGANNPNGNSAMLTPGTAGGIILGTYQNFVTDPDIPHPQGWQGDTNGDGVPDGAAGAGYKSLVTQGSAFSPFSFFGTSTYVGMNPTSYQAGTDMSAPSASVDMGSCVGTVCTLSADLSALEVYWNGSVFQQGPRPSNSGPFTMAMGTIDLADNSYSLSWASQIKQGPFNGVTGFWHLEGTLRAVPVPAAVWLLGSGLIGLIGMARRKQRS